jgi:sulfite exporter TauE/SafE
MKRNVGSIDRVIRIVGGVALIAIGLVYGTWWGALGLVPLITALIGWCPPYAILGMNTCKTKSE